MEAKAEAAAPSRSYKDFEPFCEWERNSEKDTLVVQLPPGFTEEHVKVLVSNKGLVRFSGECNTDGGTWSRFQREVRFARDCDVNGIQAKFWHGRLHIMMPKTKKPPAAPPAEESKEEANLKAKEVAERDDESTAQEGSGSRLSIRRKLVVTGFVLVALAAAFGRYSHTSRLENKELQVRYSHTSGLENNELEVRKTESKPKRISYKPSWWDDYVA